MTAPGRTAFDLVARVLGERRRGSEPPAGLRAALADQTAVDGERIVAAAAGDSVLPAFAAAVRDLGLAASLEPELRAFLDEIHAANAARNAALRAQLANAIAALNRVGIEPVLLKGTIRLVDGLYPDLGWRMMRDLDVLVPANGLGGAVAALRGAGYGPRRRPPGAGPLPVDHHHYPQLVHPDGGAPIELHTELFPAARQRRLLRAAEVLDDGAARPIAFDGAAARLPPTEHQLAHLIGHDQITNRNHLSGRVRLRERLEAAALASWSPEGVDWGAVAARFAAAGYRRPLLGFLLALDEGGFCPVSTEAATAVRIGPLARPLARLRMGVRLGPRAVWYAALLKELVTEPETRRRISSFSLPQIARRLHRGPPAS